MASKFFKVPFLEQIFEEKISLSHSKGIDKLSPFKAFHENLIDLNKISKRVVGNVFQFTSYLEILKVKKRDSNPRMLSVPTAKDRIVLLALKEYLHFHFKTRVNKKLPNSYIRDIKKYLEINKKADIYFIKADIKNFFPTIDHDILSEILAKEKLPSYILDLIIKAIKTETVPLNFRKEDKEQYISELGIPQGLSISNILAQIYVSSIDEEFSKMNVLYLRYVDDIFILMTTNRANQYRTSIIKRLSKLRLELNEHKSLQGDLNLLPTFLSYKISKTEISVSDKNVQTLIHKIAAKVTWLKNCLKDSSKRPKWIKDKKRLFDVFIEEINEKITGARSEVKNYGWLFYFIEITDVSQLFKLDNIIERMLLSTKLISSRPKKLKRIVRAYYEIKYNNGGNYIQNYDTLNTIREKRLFLLKRGKIQPGKYY
jgi:hypothetical protein